MSSEGKDKVSQIRDFLNLECSLFSVTRKCFKKCLKVPFVKDRKVYPTKDLFLLSKNDPIKQEFEAFFFNCITSCSQDFVVSRRFIKEKINTETDLVQASNQDLYQNYYSENRKTPEN